MSFSQRLKVARKNKGYTQEALSRLVNVERSSIGKYESTNIMPSPAVINRLAEVLEVSTDYLLGRAPIRPKKNTWIPVYGNVAAGIPIEEIEDIVDMEEIPEEWLKDGSTYMALRIHGESMMPNFREGDHVLVRRQPDVENGEIAIVRVNGNSATCKKIKKTADGIYLLSLNPAFEPIYYSREEIESLPVQILGKVVELRAKF